MSTSSTTDKAYKRGAYKRSRETSKDDVNGMIEDLKDFREEKIHKYKPSPCRTKVLETIQSLLDNLTKVKRNKMEKEEEKVYQILELVKGLDHRISNLEKAQEANLWQLEDLEKL